jgi:hypothetical protein
VKYASWMLVALALGCTHAEEVEGAKSAETAETAEPEPREAPASEQRSTQPPRSQGLVAGGPKAPDEIPVSTSAQGLLKPGADRAVRDKLELKEGEPLRAALKRFQSSHDMPATGALDERTVKALGLDPEDVFVSASD